MKPTSITFGDEISYGNGKVALSDILSAFTFALDLTEGALPGHGLRTCVLGMRLAHAMGLQGYECAELYYALLLKDVGCTSNAARLYAITGGDERAIKAGSKKGDWKQGSMFQMLWQNVLPGANPVSKVARILKMGVDREKNNKEMYHLRCDRGAGILRKLEMGNRAAEAVYHLDEFWDGSGYPDHLHGHAIPLMSRICAVAQNLDVFASEGSLDNGIRVLKQRRGTWFDPEIVDIAVDLHKVKSLWRNCGPDDDPERTREVVLDLDHGERNALTAERIDNICEAFASVVDAKSPFTYRHSLGVAEAATVMAKELQLSDDRIVMVRRASLLHDVGKLRVPNSILDKNGKPTDEEWSVIREHPEITRRILSRVGAFRELAVVAAEHHERLDGTGYPDRLRGDQMSQVARIIAAADVYSALAEQRPYRDALDPKVVLGIMARDVPAKMDATCFEAMTAVVERNNWELTCVVAKAMEHNAYGTSAKGICEIAPAEGALGELEAAAVV